MRIFQCSASASVFVRLTVRYCIPSIVLRSLLGVLLLTALGGCKIFHPYRLPTPKPSLEFKAHQKEVAARKKANEQAFALNKKTTNTPADEAATDVSTPSGGVVKAANSTTAEARTLPERSTLRYDKQGLMKKPALMRRRVHKHFKPFRPGQAIRNFFKFGLHAKPNYSSDHRPAPKPSAAPDAAPDAKPDVTPTAPPDGKP